MHLTLIVIIVLFSLKRILHNYDYANFFNFPKTLNTSKF